MSRKVYAVNGAMFNRLPLPTACVYARSAAAALKKVVKMAEVAGIAEGYRNSTAQLVAIETDNVLDDSVLSEG